ncbi:hypothetical protein Q7C36_007701 [Tachysurus vachellii]|uniref:Placenta-specific protein 9 n=1 Tax=Tachysurus vachellii TaxID=175792 RepID=A0AA88NEK5_TACVA|nr:hypothetical protein Q7C36_007701 [Tachysurus vachellii]
MYNFCGWPVCLLRVMAYQSIYLAVLLLLIGHMFAVHEIDPANRNNHVTPCQDHSKLNDRLDAVEKRVEETVQKLEVELAELLNTIQASEWSSVLSSDTAAAAVDILDESNVPPHS